MPSRPRQFKYDREEGVKIDALVEETFSPFVRLERRNLLFFSSISIFLSFAGPSVEKVVLLGITLQNVTFVGILFFLLLVCTYFAAGFALLAFPPFKRARDARREMLKRQLIVRGSPVPWWLLIRSVWMRSRYALWIGWELVLPLLLGLIAIGILTGRVFVET